MDQLYKNTKTYVIAQGTEALIQLAPDNIMGPENSTLKSAACMAVNLFAFGKISIRIKGEPTLSNPGY